MKILYFAALREKMGVPEEELEVPPGFTVGRLLEEHIIPRVGKEACGKLAFAVNEQHAGQDAGLDNADVVAVFPPFSGGL